MAKDLFALPADLPVPVDDGAAQHLWNGRLPDVELVATSGARVNLGGLPGTLVLFCYPRTGRPGEPALVDDWDLIPGARGCTPQVCGFRDLYAELQQAGIRHVFGLSTQTPEYQREAAERLHLPFPLLSDERLELTRALQLPTLQVAGQVLTKRLTLVARAGRILHVFYPVFPPDQSAERTLSWVRENRVLLQEDEGRRSSGATSGRIGPG
ncbi:MAG: peroxiredoxin [Verrucomicrobia bacterium]|nr:peroxiredoxin [Verrucomicrobiota bacterium]